MNGMRGLAVALAMAGGIVACAASRGVSGQDATVGGVASKRMPDGQHWMTRNLDVVTADSYCYDDDEANCRRYGRLYTWGAAQRACRSLAAGWRLPTNVEWARMAKHYGGVRNEAADSGKSAYRALITGGSSGFDAVFGGGRTDKSGEYQRADAHGFYWTASESSPGSAWFYNLGKGGQILNRHADGEKARAFAVRCVRG